MEDDPVENEGELASEDSPAQAVDAGAERVAMAIVAIVLGLFGSWMFYIVQKFLDGNGWYDRIVGLVLDELILALWLFSAVLLLRATFAPAWIERVFQSALGKLALAVLFVVTFLGVVILVFLFVLPILLSLGLVK